MRTDSTAPAMKTDVRGQGKPLVLVPGGLTGWHSWQRHAEDLSTERQVIRTQLLSVDLGLRGDPLPERYSLRTESAALARALDALDIATADVVGWSYGGAIALDMALDRPERIRSLTLIEPAAYWVLRGFGAFGADARAMQDAMRTYRTHEITPDQLERFLVGAGILRAGEDARAHPRWPVWHEHRQSLRIGHAPFDHDDAIERLGRLHRAALLFEGEGSPRYVRDTLELLGRALPDARVRELPGGHILPLVSYDAFLSTLREFLDEVDAAG